jgi:LEA14-like dessication related protein
MLKYFYAAVFLSLAACAPKEQVVFRKALNIRLDAVSNNPMLKADMVFYNPNKASAKLKKIDMDILVNEKVAGTVDQALNQKIKGESEFTVPIEVKLNLKEVGLLDTIIGIFGGKKYEVRLLGKIRVSMHGFAISVPVDQKEQIKVR